MLECLKLADETQGFDNVTGFWKEPDFNNNIPLLLVYPPASNLPYNISLEFTISFTSCSSLM